MVVLTGTSTWSQRKLVSDGSVEEAIMMSEALMKAMAELSFQFLDIDVHGFLASLFNKFYFFNAHISAVTATTS